jgi:hypothetical protein
MKKKKKKKKKRKILIGKCSVIGGVRSLGRIP